MLSYNWLRNETTAVMLKTRVSSKKRHLQRISWGKVAPMHISLHHRKISHTADSYLGLLQMCLQPSNYPDRPSNHTEHLGNCTQKHLGNHIQN